MTTTALAMAPIASALCQRLNCRLVVCFCISPLWVVAIVYLSFCISCICFLWTIALWTIDIPRWVSLGGSLLAFTGMTLSAFMPRYREYCVTKRKTSHSPLAQPRDALPHPGTPDGGRSRPCDHPWNHSHRQILWQEEVKGQRSVSFRSCCGRFHSTRLLHIPARYLWISRIPSSHRCLSSSHLHIRCLVQVC